MADLVLEIVEGPGAGTVFPLAGTLEIGRGSAAAIRLADAHADPLHARIAVDGRGVELTDLGPRGGTFVNHVELLASTRIEPGDEIQVGVTVLRLRPRGAPSAARATPPAPAASAAATAPGRQARDEAADEVDSLLDARTKRKARHAPLAVLVVVVYAVLLYVWTSHL